MLQDANEIFNDFFLALPIREENLSGAITHVYMLLSNNFRIYNGGTVLVTEVKMKCSSSILYLTLFNTF